MNHPAITAETIAAAERLRRAAMAAMDGVFKDIDAMIGEHSAASMLTITNFTGQPSLTLPAGFLERQLLSGGTLSSDAQSEPGPAHRMPHGITLWGRLFDEGTLCAMALEAEFDLGGERPPTG